MGTSRPWAAIAGIRPRCWLASKNDRFLLQQRGADCASANAALGGKHIRHGPFRYRHRNGARHLQSRPPKIARTVKQGHGRALELWQANIREARLLALYTAEPEKLTADLARTWSDDFHS